MKYPALVINAKKLKENAANIRQMLDENNIHLCAVTKCLRSMPELVDIYIQAGITQFGDSRVDNLKNLPNGVKRWLLRIPMLCEAADVVRYADISLNSELLTMAALSEEALKTGSRHGVILMIDIGDLREGVWPTDAVDFAAQVLKLPGIELLGVGTNTNCYGGIIPTTENLSHLVSIAEAIESECNISLQIISGGNSGAIYLVENGNIPKRINNLRLGESILMGHDASYQRHIAGMHTDVFRLHTQIIELKQKPSIPIGDAGLDAFGEEPVFIDKGLMLRAIVACGRQDVAYDKLSPLDDRLEILGSSSDHMILDVTHARGEYNLGDIVEFSVNYSSLLSLCTSDYVNKIII